MGNIRKPHPVKLIAGIIASSEKAFLESEKALEKYFGRIDYKSGRIKFNFTKYYQKDMGADLERLFIGFGRLVSPDKLSAIKVITNDIENRAGKRMGAAKRAVNIDPGYLNDAKLVLASTKDYSHRIYLAKGIYAEVTLQYREGSFRAGEWTYPDYRTDEYIKIFNEIRSLYMRQKDIS